MASSHHSPKTIKNWVKDSLILRENSRINACQRLKKLRRSRENKRSQWITSETNSSRRGMILIRRPERSKKNWKNRSRSWRRLRKTSMLRKLSLRRMWLFWPNSYNLSQANVKNWGMSFPSAETNMRAGLKRWRLTRGWCRMKWWEIKSMNWRCLRKKKSTGFLKGIQS